MIHQIQLLHGLTSDFKNLFSLQIIFLSVAMKRFLWCRTAAILSRKFKARGNLLLVYSSIDHQHGIINIIRSYGSNQNRCQLCINLFDLHWRLNTILSRIQKIIHQNSVQESPGVSPRIASSSDGCRLCTAVLAQFKTSSIHSVFCKAKMSKLKYEF